MEAPELPTLPKTKPTLPEFQVRKFQICQLVMWRNHFKNADWPPNKYQEFHLRTSERAVQHCGVASVSSADSLMVMLVQVYVDCVNLKVSLIVAHVHHRMFLSSKSVYTMKCSYHNSSYTVRYVSLRKACVHHEIFLLSYVSHLHYMPLYVSHIRAHITMGIYSTDL
mgnify:CR=1 FL=1